MRPGGIAMIGIAVLSARATSAQAQGVVEAPPNVVVQSPAASPQPVRPRPAAPARRISAFVHIDSAHPVELEMLSDDAWGFSHTVCTSPCDAVLPIEPDYDITGDFVRSSRAFSLSEDFARQTLKVDRRLIWGHAAGLALTLVGAPTAAFGYAGWFFSSFSDGDVNRTPYVVVGLVGLGAIVAGVVLMVVYRRRTTVAVVPSAAAAAPRWSSWPIFTAGREMPASGPVGSAIGIPIVVF